MKRTDKERQIERYVDRRMSADEMRAFEDRLHADPDLRASVRAEELIRGVLTKDRSAIPADHGAMRAKMLALVATVPPAGAVPPGGGSGAGGTGSAIGSAAVVKAVTVVVATVAILTGAYFLSRSVTAIAPERARVPAAEQAPAPRFEQQPAVAPEHAAPVPAAETGSSHRPAASTMPAASGTDHAAQAPQLQRIDARGDGSAASGSAVISTDTVRMKVNLNLNRIRKGEGQ